MLTAKKETNRDGMMNIDNAFNHLASELLLEAVHMRNQRKDVMTIYSLVKASLDMAAKGRTIGRLLAREEGVPYVE